MKVALLTSGGIAPCLSASIGRLAKQYYSKYPDVEIIGYLNGYKGLLLGKSIQINNTDNFDRLYAFGGTPIGNSRVKLTNHKNCIKNGYEPLGSMVALMLNYNKNIRHLKMRIKNELG